jgi:hypothetical protein
MVYVSLLKWFGVFFVDMPPQKERTSVQCAAVFNTITQRKVPPECLRESIPLCGIGRRANNLATCTAARLDTPQTMLSSATLQSATSHPTLDTAHLYSAIPHPNQQRQTSPGHVTPLLSYAIPQHRNATSLLSYTHPNQLRNTPPSYVTAILSYMPQVRSAMPYPNQ